MSVHTARLFILSLILLGQSSLMTTVYAQNRLLFFRPEHLHLINGQIFLSMEADLNHTKVYSPVGLRVAISPNVTASFMDHTGREAMGSFYNGNIWEAKQLDDNAESCGTLKNPCWVTLKRLPNPLNDGGQTTDFMDLATRTCWFQLLRSAENHYPEVDTYRENLRRCELSELGIYHYRTLWKHTQETQTWGNWLRANVFDALERVADMHFLFPTTRSPTPSSGAFTFRSLIDQEPIHAFREVLQNAKRRVWIATYNFNDESAVTQLLTLLKGGVEVRILYDLEFMLTPQKTSQMARLSRAGAVVLPVTLPSHDEGRAWFHPKAYLIDESLLVGTFNIGENPEAVRERAFQFERNARTLEIEKAFTYWQTLACRNRIQTQSQLASSCDPLSRSDCKDLMRGMVVACSDWSPLRAGSISWEIGDASVRFYLDGVTLRDRLYRLFREADAEILVKAPTISFEPLVFYLNLLAAQNPSVRVRFVMPKRTQGSLDPKAWPHINFEFTDSVSHEKIILVDKTHLLLTSANFSHRGFLHNTELATLVNLAHVDPKVRTQILKEIH